MLTLYQIESDLAQLIEERDCAEYESDSEALAVIDGLIKDYIGREARKIDSGAALIKSDLATAKLLKEEAARLTDRAKAFENRAARIKAAWCEAMGAQGIKELKSEHNTILRKGNGGVRPLEIRQPELVPTELQTVTLTCSRSDWDHLGAIPVLDMRFVKCEPNTAAIRRELEAGRAVPGCTLLNRGEHLEVR